MIKKICYCDRCNTVTNEPVDLALGSLDIETGDVSSWPERPDSNLQLCDTCARLVLRFATTVLGVQIVTDCALPDEERPTTEEVSPPRRRKIDRGKIVALRTAGWKIADIADEMKLKSSQVSNILWQERKRLGKEETNGKEQGNDADQRAAGSDGEPRSDCELLAGDPGQ